MRLAASVLLLALAAPAVTADWSSFHGDERNTGFQSGTDYKVYEDVWWNVKIPNAQVEASPVVADGFVVIAGWDSQLRVYDAQSGQPVWNATFGAKMVGTPVIFGGKLFAVDSAGTLKSFDLQKGTVLGTATVGATFGSITVHEGKLFVGNEAGEMKAFDTGTLTLLWNFPISSIASTGNATACGTKFVARPIRSAPVVYADKVVFASLNNWVFAISDEGRGDLTTRAQWIFETGGTIFGSPMVDATRGRIVIGSDDGKVYSLAVTPSGSGPIDTGTAVCTAKKNTASWTFVVGQDVKISSTPATDGTNVYFGANNDRIYAITAAAGKKVWEFTTGDAVTSSPAVANKVVVAGSDDGWLYWLNASSGAQHKSFNLGAPVKSSPAIDGDRAFIASFYGDVYMFGPAIPRRPDLQVASVSYAEGVITVLVQNAGDGAAAASTLRITVDGVLAGDVAVPEVVPGGSQAVTHVMALSSGTHTITAVADQTGVVTESTENNNERSQSVEVGGGSGSGGKKEGGGGIKIPGLPLGVLLVALAALVLATRRRK